MTNDEHPKSETPSRQAESSPANQRGWAVVLVLFLGVVSAGWILWERRDPTVSRENGPMENFQLACLVMGLLFWIGSIRKASGYAPKVFLCGLALFYLTVIMNELDVRPFGIPILIFLLRGWVRNTVLTLLWIGAFYLFMKQWREVLGVFRNWIRGKAGVMMLAAGCLWLLSGASDKSLGLPKNLFLEEIFEVNAAILMCGSAWETFRRTEPGLAINSAG